MPAPRPDVNARKALHRAVEVATTEQCGYVCGSVRKTNRSRKHGGAMHSNADAQQDDLLTIADIARHFGLPESTARYYCKRFAPFMPSVGEGRRRRFRPEALAVVEAVLDAMQTARNATAVEARLTGRFARNAAVVPSPPHDFSAPAVHAPSAPALPAQAVPTARPHEGLPPVALALMEQQGRTLEGIASALNTLAARQDDLARLVAHARAAEEEVATLRREVSNLRLLLDASEKTQQQDLEQLRTWLGRIIAEKRRNVRS